MSGADDGGVTRLVLLGSEGMLWADPDGLDPRRIVGQSWRLLGWPYLEFCGRVLQRCTLELEPPLPDGADIDEAMASIRRAAMRSGTPTEAFARFVSAWSVMPVRISAAKMHGRLFEREFAQILGRQGHAPQGGGADTRLERHVLAQWRRLDGPLFDTVINAHSALEAFGFSIYIAASLSRPAAFPAESGRDIRQISLENTIRALGDPNGYPASRLTKHLKAVVRSEPYGRLKSAWNALLHRGMPIGMVYPSSTDGSFIYHLDRYSESDHSIALPRDGATVGVPGERNCHPVRTLRYVR